MSIKIGANPIAWTNDDMPELGGDTSLDVCLREMRQAGFSGTEMGGRYPRESSDLRDILDAHDLQLVSGWWEGNTLENDIDTAFQSSLPHLKLLRDLGAKHVVYGEGSMGRHGGIWNPISQRPSIAASNWKAYGDKLTQIADRMADFGVAMAFHHHMGTIVESDGDVDRLMEVTGPSVGLLFDTGHCLLSGGNPVELCKRHKDRIVHVHCKDVRPVELTKTRAHDLSFMRAILDGIFTVPGDGCIDFPTILKTLKEANYQGWLVVEAEQDPRKAPPFHYASLGYGNLSAMVRDAGFEIAPGSKHGHIDKTAS